MAVSSFPSFHRLPTELRLQIWTVACVSHQPDGYGIHYIDVEPTSTEGSLSPSSTFTACLAEGDKGSACLRTGGLWTACKESRDVMIQNSKVDGHDCARISIRGKGEEWDSPVNPTHDVFCIKSQTWNTPDNHAEGWQIQIPDLSPRGSQTTNIQNIAFEFDQSWTKDLPKCYYDLMSETSARGFLSRLLYNTFLNDSTTPQIWIIVKNGQWTIDPYRPRPTNQWHDYDTDYVPVNPYFFCPYCLSSHESDGVVQRANSFIYSLDALGGACEKDYRNYSPIYDEAWYGSIYDSVGISVGVKLLAHRDMQIGFCTGPGPDDDWREEEEDGREHEEEDDSDLEY